MVTPTDFKSRFPEFSTIDDSRIQLFLDDAELEISQTVWGKLYDKGISYLTAHELSMATATENGKTGGLKSEASKSVGNVSVSYNNPTYDEYNNYYTTTAYGKKFIDMKNKIKAGKVCLI
jgi:hypothetical protein